MLSEVGEEMVGWMGKFRTMILRGSSVKSRSRVVQKRSKTSVRYSLDENSPRSGLLKVVVRTFVLVAPSHFLSGNVIPRRRIIVIAVSKSDSQSYIRWGGNEFMQ